MVVFAVVSVVYLLLYVLQVESKLIKRLSLAIQSWTECLNGIVVEGAGGADTTMDTTSSGTAQPQHKLGGTPELEVRELNGLVVCQSKCCSMALCKLDIV